MINNYSLKVNPSDFTQDAVIEKRTKILSQMNSRVSKKESVNEICCRICFAGEPTSDVNIPSPSLIKDEPLLKEICKCKGSLSYVHESCLIKWLRTKNSKCCELCLQDYDITYQYGSFKQISLRAFKYIFNDKKRLLTNMLYGLYLWIFFRRFLHLL